MAGRAPSARAASRINARTSSLRVKFSESCNSEDWQLEFPVTRTSFKCVRAFRASFFGAPRVSTVAPCDPLPPRLGALAAFGSRGLERVFAQPLRIVAQLTGENFNMRDMQVELAKARATLQGWPEKGSVGKIN